MIDMTFVLPVDMTRDVYALHQRLEDAYGPRSAAKYLWAAVPVRRGTEVLLLVRAPEAPANLAPASIYVVPEPPVGTELSFTVQAMPTVKDARTGRRKPFTRDNNAGREAWFRRRAARSGFDVVAMQQSTSRRWIAKPTPGRQGDPWWIDATTFVGRLRVTDAPAFRATLVGGFGHGRAWGCGLLVVA